MCNKFTPPQNESNNIHIKECCFDDSFEQESCSKAQAFVWDGAYAVLRWKGEIVVSQLQGEALHSELLPVDVSFRKSDVERRHDKKMDKIRSFVEFYADVWKYLYAHHPAFFEALCDKTCSNGHAPIVASRAYIPLMRSPAEVFDGRFIETDYSPRKCEKFLKLLLQELACCSEDGSQYELAILPPDDVLENATDCKKAECVLPVLDGHHTPEKAAFTAVEDSAFGEEEKSDGIRELSKSGNAILWQELLSGRVPPQRKRYDDRHHSEFASTVPCPCVVGETIYLPHGQCRWGTLYVSIIEHEIQKGNPRLHALYSEPLRLNDSPLWKRYTNGVSSSFFMSSCRFGRRGEKLSVLLSNGYWVYTKYAGIDFCGVITEFCLYCGYSPQEIVLYGKRRDIVESEYWPLAAIAVEQGNGKESGHGIMDDYKDFVRRYVPEIDNDWGRSEIGFAFNFKNIPTKATFMGPEYARIPFENRPKYCRFARYYEAKFEYEFFTNQALKNCYIICDNKMYRVDYPIDFSQFDIDAIRQKLFAIGTKVQKGSLDFTELRILEELDFDEMELKSAVIPTKEIVKILTQYFSSGFRCSAPGDLRKFKIRAEEAGLALPENHDWLKNAISKAGIVIKGFVYCFDNDLQLEIQKFIDDVYCDGKRVVYYECLYYKHEDWMKTHRILSTDILKSVLQAYVGKKACQGINSEYFYADDYMVKGGEYRRKEIIIQELVRVWGDSATNLLSDLEERLPYIPKNVIERALKNDRFVYSGKEFDDKRYLLIDRFYISDDEKRNVIQFVENNCEQYGYIPLHNIPIRNILKENEPIPDIVACDVVYRVVLSEYYNNASKIISKKGIKLDPNTILKYEIRNRDECFLDDAMRYMKELTGKESRYRVFQVLYDEMVRVGENSFVSERFVVFSNEKIDQIDLILEEHCISNHFCSMREITSFLLFPSCGRSWNHYLLSSFCYRFSKKYMLVNRGFSNNNFGIIAERAFVNQLKVSDDEKYEELLSYALAASDIFLPSDIGKIMQTECDDLIDFDVKKKILQSINDYFRENGYIGRSMSDDVALSKIINRAVEIRESR